MLSLGIHLKFFTYISSREQMKWFDTYDNDFLNFSTDRFCGNDGDDDGFPGSSWTSLDIHLENVTIYMCECMCVRLFAQKCKQFKIHLRLRFRCNSSVLSFLSLPLIAWFVRSIRMMDVGTFMGHQERHLVGQQWLSMLTMDFLYVSWHETWTTHH